MVIRHIILIIIILCIILLYYLIINKNTINEGFNDMCELVYDYENYPQQGPVYSSIDDCLAKNTDIVLINFKRDSALKMGLDYKNFE